jgi:DNA-binding transcriptional regulator YiaG
MSEQDDAVHDLTFASYEHEMTFAALRNDAGLTLDEFAAQFRVPAEIVASWEDGSRQAPPHVCRSLNVLKQYAPVVTSDMNFAASRSSSAG